jgi:hypothetical protein
MFRFGSPEGAAAALDTVAADYRRHCEAARDIAVTLFRSDVALEPILQQAL